MPKRRDKRPQKRKVNDRYRNHPVWVDGHIEWLTEAEHRALHERQTRNAKAR